MSAFLPLSGLLEQTNKHGPANSVRAGYRNVLRTRKQRGPQNFTLCLKDMNYRREIQENHEIYLVDCFIDWWEEKTGEKFKVISRPHQLPPEAIVQSSSRTTWLEVTDTFFSDEFAKDLYSYATPGEEHLPMASGPFENMDEKTSLRFVNLIKKKLCKSSYKTVFEQYGQGYLLVGMQSPWFDGHKCELMAKHCRNEDWSPDRGYFSKIFISFRSLNRQVFEEWKF